MLRNCAISIILNGIEWDSRKYCPSWNHIAQIEDECSMILARAIFSCFQWTRPFNIIFVIYIRHICESNCIPFHLNVFDNIFPTLLLPISVVCCGCDYHNILCANDLYSIVYFVQYVTPVPKLTVLMHDQCHRVESPRMFHSSTMQLKCLA